MKQSLKDWKTGRLEVWSPRGDYSLRLYQVLSSFLLACCFVAVFLLSSAVKQQANSNLERRMQQQNPIFITPSARITCHDKAGSLCEIII